MKNIRKIWLVLAFLVGLVMISCGDDSDITGECAGCEDSDPWSVFGSDQCYKTLELCEAAERGICVICN